MMIEEMIKVVMYPYSPNDKWTSCLSNNKYCMSRKVFILLYIPETICSLSLYYLLSILFSPSTSNKELSLAVPHTLPLLIRPLDCQGCAEVFWDLSSLLAPHFHMALFI